MGRVVLGGVLGGVIVFFWGAFAHMHTPIGTMGLRSIPGDERGVLASMKAAISEKGLYFFPGGNMATMSESERAAWTEKFRAGPSGILIINPGGAEPMSPGQLLTELASNVAAALLAAFLLTRVVGGYFARAGFLALVALFGWVAIVVSYWNWYGFPPEFIAAALVDEVVGWLLAGLAIAAIVRPRGVSDATVGA